MLIGWLNHVKTCCTNQKNAYSPCVYPCSVRASPIFSRTKSCDFRASSTSSIQGSCPNPRDLDVAVHRRLRPAICGFMFKNYRIITWKYCMHIRTYMYIYIYMCVYRYHPHVRGKDTPETFLVGKL